MNAPIELSSSSLAFAGPALIDASIKGALILATIAAATVILRKSSAATRHFVWMLGILALLALPLLTTVLPGWRVLPAWTSLAESASTPPLRNSADSVAFPETPLSLPPAAAPAMESPAASTVSSAQALPAPAAQPSEPPAARTTSEWLSLLWIFIAVALLLRLAVAALLLRRLTSGAAQVTTGRIHSVFSRVCQELGIGREVRVHLCGKCSSPLVWGVLRPRLLLPQEAEHWDDSRLRAVLLHELAHIKRGDLIAMLLTQVACGIHWFNPFAWLAAWRLAVERERACDDCALAAGLMASDYAEHLLHIATEARSPASPAALAMARPSRLEGRLLAVLEPEGDRRALPRWAAWTGSALVAAVSIPLAMVQAQETGSLRDAAAREASPVEDARKSASAELERFDRATGPRSTKSSGRWALADGVVLTIHQEIYHGADVSSSAILQWPAREGRPAIRHEFSLASDAFGNRHPWRMAWDPEHPVAWIALGDSHFIGDKTPAKHRLSRVRKLDFSDPARIVETHFIPAGPMPDFARAAFAEDFELPASADAAQTQIYTEPALLEHSWIISGVTKTATREVAGNVPIALSVDDDSRPFEQTRSGPDGRYWCSFRPPVTALGRGCVVHVRRNQSDGREAPANFQEHAIKVTAEELRLGMSDTREPGASSIAGTLETSNHEPIGGALIAVIADGQPLSSCATRTDAGGRFQLRDVPAGRDVALLVEATRWKRRATAQPARFDGGKTHAVKLTIAQGQGWEWKLTVAAGEEKEPARGGGQNPPQGAAAVAPAPLEARATAAKDAIRVDVEIAANGAVSVNGSIVALEQLTDTLTAPGKTNPPRAITVRAHKSVPYERVVRVLDACAKAGLRVSIGTFDDDSKSAEASRAEDAARKIAAIRLRYAERQVERLNALEKSRAVSAEELNRARTELKILQAESAGDSKAVAKLRLAAAEEELHRLRELHRQRLVSAEEIDRATLEMEIRRAELRAHDLAPADRSGAGNKSDGNSQHFTGITRPAGRLPVHGFDGVITEVLVAPGAKVKAGDVLVRLDTSSVLAPCDGRVTAIHKQVGEMVGRADAVAEMVPDATAVAHFYVPPRAAKRANVGGAARVQVEDGSEMNGRIATIAETDPASGLIRISILLASPDRKPSAEQKATWVFDAD